jgi:ABC-type phosphate transport system substrate-binding protein
MRIDRIRQFAVGSISLVAVAAGLTVGVSTPASAQVKIYGAGATLPAFIYRDLFNCWGKSLDNAAGDFSSPSCVDPKNANRVLAYAPVGSGAGQRSYIFDDPTRVGIPATTNTVPYSNTSGPVPTINYGLNFSTTAPTGFPAHHFSGSDANVPQHPAVGGNPQVSFDCYNGVGVDPACTVDRRTIAGPAVQIPTVVTTVNIPYRVPGLPKLQLSERSLCGIFTGAITDWNDPQISADNGGSVTGGVPHQIIVAVRSDGSGTTFLFTNHLEAVCDGVRGASWTGGVGTSVSWPSPFFYKVPGNEGVAQVVASTDYAIGYTTPELTKPAVTTVEVPSTFVANDGNGANPVTVNAGDYPARQKALLENKSGKFILPNPTVARNAMSSASPPTGAAALVAANWGDAGLVPDPTQVNGYPISGFTWFLGYTCYKTNQVGAGLRQFFSWYLVAGGQVVDILKSNQFGALPLAWRTAAKSLVVFDQSTRISGVGEPVGVRNPICTGKVGAGA